MDSWYDAFVLMVLFLVVWYFSELGQLWTYAFSGVSWVFSVILFKKPTRERGTQTKILQETSQTKLGCESDDELDGIKNQETAPRTMSYPNVQRSLLQAFKCAYVHLIQSWYTVPELLESQPLHRALQKEYNLIVERIICRAESFDLSTTSVGCIRIFTKHLHNAKQSDSSPGFSSLFEEMEVLRTFSDVLVRNFFPEYLWSTKIYKCFLTELVAIKVLDALVECLCNPDNLNQMMILLMESVSLKSSTEVLYSDREGSSPSTESEGSEVCPEETEERTEEIKEKKKGNRIKEKFSKFVLKVKAKKLKKKKLKEEQKLLLRALSARRSAVIEDNDGCSTDGSTKSHIDSDIESEIVAGLENIQEDMMEFRLSNEMWRVGKWAVSVTNVQEENEELCFIIHLEEKNNPENLQWDVKKTQSEIIHFHSLWQDTSTLSSISAIVDKAKREINEEYTEEVRLALQQFLQELVSDSQLGLSQPVFQFLCPIEQLLCNEDQEGGVWGLLSGLAYFLTPGQDEEESNNPKEEKPDEEGTSALHCTPTTAQQASIDGVEEPSALHCTPTTAQQACMDVVEEPENSSCVYPEELNPFRNEEPDRDDINQISDDADTPSDGQDSVAESIDVFVNRSKLVAPTVMRSDNNHNEGVQTVSVDGNKTPSGNKAHKKEKSLTKKCNMPQKLKVKEKTVQTKEEMTSPSQTQKKEQTNWDQLEATKAIFDLLKEVTGNSFLINIFDAILKPVQPLVKKKVNNFLKRLHPTEVQIASYIDILREYMWPEGNVELQPPRSTEDINETKEKALQLLHSKYSNSLILKKTDVETVFKIFQAAQENKKLVYALILFLLREFLPEEPALNTISNQIVKDVFS